MLALCIRGAQESEITYAEYGCGCSFGTVWFHQDPHQLRQRGL